MQHRHHTERFHDLDALRAWAMLLGIVLHAAWMMTPVYWGAPIHDVDGGYVPQWIVWWIHMFRLQAFFLIAGLFAHLVYRRQKTWGFIKHRLSRIGIPLVVGCLIIYPVWFMQDAWAGLLQGRIQSNDSFWSVFSTQISRSYREVLDTFHLWFLYDLLLVYALTLLVIFIFRHVIDRRQILRGWISRGFRWAMQSPYLLLFLVVPSALLLMQSKFWSGIEAYPVWFVPEWPGVVLYWFFFAVGWYLYAHLDLLAIVQRAWVQRLVVGTVVSIGMFAVYSAYVRENVTSFYPAVEAGDVRYGSLRSELLAARERGPENATYQVWSALTPEWQTFITDATDVNPDQQAGLALQLTERVIGGKEFTDLAAWNLSAYPELRNNLVELEALERNRKILEAALPGSIAPQITQLTSVKWAKFGYMLVYSVGMWLLVFGFVGFFHHFFQHPSPAMRYLADSSYWLYIVHLNILFQLGIWVADVPMSWPIKLTFYSVAAVAIMIPSYHWLVRSSFIGEVLNGRRYPYVPLFESPLFHWRRQADVAPASESPPTAAHDETPQQAARHIARPHFDAKIAVSDATADPT